MKVFKPPQDTFNALKLKNLHKVTLQLLEELSSLNHSDTNGLP